MTDPLAADISRMRRHAQGYLDDATSLQSMVATKSDGAYLLQLIAFEILLKAVLRVHGKVPGRNHKYSDLFNELPPAAQRGLLDTATARFGPKADFSRPPHLLDTWSSNLVKLRYSYEEYAGMTPDAVSERGTRWIAAGAKTEDADFQYYPMELDALTEALGKELDSLSAGPE